MHLLCSAVKVVCILNHGTLMLQNKLDNVNNVRNTIDDLMSFVVSIILWTFETSKLGLEILIIFKLASASGLAMLAG